MKKNIIIALISVYILMKIIALCFIAYFVVPKIFLTSMLAYELRPEIEEDMRETSPDGRHDLILEYRLVGAMSANYMDVFIVKEGQKTKTSNKVFSGKSCVGTVKWLNEHSCEVIVDSYNVDIEEEDIYKRNEKYRGIDIEYTFSK